MSRRLYLVLGVIAVSVAAIAGYAAAGIASYVSHQKTTASADAVAFNSETQTSNRIARSDRRALLLDSPSYANFSPSLLALDLSRFVGNPRGTSDVSRNTNGLLNDAQIAGIESRLRLTPRQAEYWPAVAVALRDIGHRYFPARRPHRTAAPKLEIQSPEVQRLIATATPLILQLSEDQKREVRQLVRIIGLEKVAAQI